jgi:DNA-binding PadR family transcriptional regulator
MYDLTGFQRDLLFVLVGMEGPSGQEIRTELERSQDREVKRARLYANLDALVDEGLVEKDRRDGRTNRYTTTEEGCCVAEARYEWEERYLRAVAG